MKAQSTVYVQLQNIYKAKARQDVGEVLEAIRVHPEGKTIDVAVVEAFCKNAAFIKLIHGTTSFQVSPSTIKALAGMYCHLHVPSNAKIGDRN
jgi:amyloid beta precursor protein binding protein 1